MINTLYLPELREMLELGTSRACANSARRSTRPARPSSWRNPHRNRTVVKAADRRHAEIFAYLEREKQIEIIETCDREGVSQLIADMPPDDRVDLLNSIDPEVAAELLALITPEQRRDIQRLQSYPEGTAGALMTTEVARLPESLTVRAALEELSRIAENLETIYYVYIVDNENHLRGAVSARQLVTHLNRPNMPITELMERSLVTVEATDDQEAVARKVADYDFPVIRSSTGQYLVGIVATT
jgi:magnesium transporter